MVEIAFSKEIIALQDKLKEFSVQKKAMEVEMQALTECLTAPGMPGLSGNLIDDEGFPRADIDLVQVRTMRGRLAYLNTDLSSVMKQLENGLAELHKAYRDAELVKDDQLGSKKQSEEVKVEETKMIVDSAVEEI